MDIDPASFQVVQQVVAERSAIILREGKEYLVEARLKSVCEHLEFESFTVLAEALRSGSTDVVEMVVEALTTNETFFFRDERPFDALRKSVIPGLIEARRGERSLRIWCAASSSGQEPLSVAMLLQENFPEIADWDVRILGSDISNEMIQRCRRGRYSELEVSRGLPTELRDKYFKKVGVHWQATAQLLGAIDYQQMNLALPFTGVPKMDVVLCRNVLIYFDRQTKARILDGIRDVLREDGSMFLGTAESTMGIHTGFRAISCEDATRYQLVRG